MIEVQIPPQFMASTFMDSLIHGKGICNTPHRLRMKTHVYMVCTAQLECCAFGVYL